MHEVELGVWKALFTHLIRILYAVAPSGQMVVELNHRFRQIPPFGCTTIRRFSENVSEMKKMAARNYEDLLQCSITAFEGLLPSEFDNVIMSLLYRFAEWHALAKLRMHTDSTLDRLRQITEQLGKCLRHFHDHVCPAFKTVELPKEARARTRQDQQRASMTQNNQKPSGETHRLKAFNLCTYKHHAFGDYAHLIPRLRTTDSANLNISKPSDTMHLPTKMIPRANSRDWSGKLRCRPQHVSFVDSEPLPYTDIHMHHHMSDSMSYPRHLFAFVHELGTDPAVKNFIPQLKNHLLSRLLGLDFDGNKHEYMAAQCDSVIILGNKIYHHKVLRVNYTIYDIRRNQDSMNSHAHCDIMIHSCESGPGVHPYWYARVIGIFHASVVHADATATNCSLQRIEFLWREPLVRWMTGHLIIFIDRDMFMRYQGCGIGHGPHQSACDGHAEQYNEMPIPTTSGVTQVEDDDNSVYEIPGSVASSIPGMSESDDDKSRDSDSDDDGTSSDLSDELGPEDGEDPLDSEDEAISLY
ncbi:predicted protein [Postia placenta Mad-698-R]|uniref:Uncharacterized protein n=1 Tax=Postia placenta MAD-698-R-SB12 TaxID=670580 RepID=A0A1X6N2B9_9APHY|nr:hypothetical protein POSPLADRAFT_1141311 [Postia placenta MAD-698-R-SB12]EED82444.1 predicted protein [Postia placenta Mad-698-R]OSX62622.1 hypothetical protein POSPLADRAFT_1141311 [Postia placenta MAD-698-R-SB12]